MKYIFSDLTLECGQGVGVEFEVEIAIPQDQELYDLRRMGQPMKE